MKNRRQYDKEFKQMTVDLSRSHDNFRELAKELDIRPELLYRWRREGRQGWLYLTVILDLADRKVVGWAMSSSLKAYDTSIVAWKMAVKRRPITQELIFHSDRGIQ